MSTLCRIFLCLPFFTFFEGNTSEGSVIPQEICFSAHTDLNVDENTGDWKRHNNFKNKPTTCIFGNIRKPFVCFVFILKRQIISCFIRNCYLFLKGHTHLMTVSEDDGAVTLREIGLFIPTQEAGKFKHQQVKTQQHIFDTFQMSWIKQSTFCWESKMLNTNERKKHNQFM